MSKPIIIVGSVPLAIGEVTYARLNRGVRKVVVLKPESNHGTLQPFGYLVQVVKDVTKPIKLR